MFMSENQRILVVDDEPQIARVMRRILSAQRYEVRVAADGEAALELFHDWPPDLVITDLQMPNVDGMELCRRLRAVAATPIIVLSVKNDDRAKVAALDAGADDYITKPFSADELLARVRAVLRRAPVAARNANLIETGDFRLDLAAHTVQVRGAEVRLTPKEFDLLAYLLKNAGRVLTHRALLGAVWGGNFTEQNEYLRVFVGHLRKKIEPDPANPQYIRTEPWIGYRFSASVAN